jgi:tRNA pseudouridine38-40 synthase
MMGTLRLAGNGKWTTQDVVSALEAKDRSAAGPTAPPEGLYLVEVGY